ncbi:hypothetical protein MY3296_000937 [Beauveria thailandica]
MTNPPKTIQGSTWMAANGLESFFEGELAQEQNVLAVAPSRQELGHSA